MKLETLLQILFENGHEDLIALAVKLDNNINTEQPKSLICRIYKEDLAEGTKFEDRESYGNVECNVLAFNKYKTRDQYLVQLPNGKTKTVSKDEGGRLTAIVPIEEPKKEQATKPPALYQNH